MASTAHADPTVWVGPDVIISGHATVFDHVRLEGQVRVFGHARLMGRALVQGRVKVHGSALVSGDAVLLCLGPYPETLVVKDRAVVTDSARVEGASVVGRGARVSGRAQILSSEIYGVVSDSAVAWRSLIEDGCTAANRARLSAGASLRSGARASGLAVLNGPVEIRGLSIDIPLVKFTRPLVLRSPGQARRYDASLPDVGEHARPSTDKRGERLRRGEVLRELDPARSFWRGGQD